MSHDKFFISLCNASFAPQLFSSLYYCHDHAHSNTPVYHTAPVEFELFSEVFSPWLSFGPVGLTGVCFIHVFVRTGYVALVSFVREVSEQLRLSVSQSQRSCNDAISVSECLSYTKNQH